MSTISAKTIVAAAYLVKASSIRRRRKGISQDDAEDARTVEGVVHQIDC